MRSRCPTENLGIELQECPEQLPAFHTKEELDVAVCGVVPEATRAALRGL